MTDDMTVATEALDDSESLHSSSSEDTAGPHTFLSQQLSQAKELGE